jgi:hypothetical protein
MTISRSKAADAVAYVLLLIGIVGFFVCWGIGWNSQLQVLGRTEQRHPSAQRTAPIEMKGVTWYVEPEFAHRYNLADNLIAVFWVAAVVGGGVKERKRIAAWWRLRKERQ